MKSKSSIWESRIFLDARVFQIVFLGITLIYGVWISEIGCDFRKFAVLLLAALTTQSLLIWWLRLPISSLLSALVTGLGLSLLLRSNNLFILSIAPVVAILSKFVFRWNGKHFFNPANFGILCVLIFSDQAWVSPGQWGTSTVLALWLLALGIWVTVRAQRVDISLSFLSAYAILLGARILYLGLPEEIFFHQMNNGALLIFCFFMLSDPRSTPNHALARLLFGAVVAVIYSVLRFVCYWPDSLVWSLFLVSPLTPFLDKIWQNKAFTWRSRKAYDPPSLVCTSVFGSLSPTRQ